MIILKRLQRRNQYYGAGFIESISELMYRERERDVSMYGLVYRHLFSSLVCLKGLEAMIPQ